MTEAQAARAAAAGSSPGAGRTAGTAPTVGSASAADSDQTLGGAPVRAGQAGAGMPLAGLIRGAGLLAVAVTAAGVVAALVGTAVTSPPAVAGLTPGPVVRYGIPTVRTFLDLAATAVVGLTILPKLLGFDSPEQTEPVLRPVRRAAVWCSAVWFFTCLISIVLLAAEFTPGQVVSPVGVWRYVTAVAPGKGLAFSAVFALLSWWLSRLAVRHGERVPAELRAGVALFGLLPLPLTGHASNWYYHDLSMVSMELHVTGSAAWAGGLAVIVLALSRRRDLLAIALPRFSTLATWCVFVVGLSGLANGLIELYLSPITTLPWSLVTTRYGVLVLVKAACIAVVGVLALHVRTRIVPAVAAGRRTTFAAWCGWEIGVLAVAFGVAVVITKAPVTPW